jgi:hypothetical protein
MRRRPIWARTTGKRAGRDRLAAGRVHVTRRGRSLNAAERAEVARRQHAEGRI